MWVTNKKPISVGRNQAITKGAVEMGGYLFALMAAIVLPLAAMVFMAVRYRSYKPVVYGAACFFFFQMVLRIPLLQLVLPNWTEYLIFQITRPVLYLVFLSLTAGLFEEIGRYITMSLFLKKMSLTGAVAFGIGHGGIEALLLVGINLAAVGITGAMAIDGTTSSLFFMGGMERIFAMMVHVSLSIMVWRALKEKRLSLLFTSIAIHTLLNVIGTYQAHRGLSPWMIEASIGLFAGALLVYTVFSVKTIQQGGNY